MSGYWEIVGNIGDWIIVRDFGCERPNDTMAQQRTTTCLSYTHVPLDDDRLRGPQQDITQGPGEKGSIVGSAERYYSVQLILRGADSGHASVTRQTSCLPVSVQKIARLSNPRDSSSRGVISDLEIIHGNRQHSINLNVRSPEGVPSTFTLEPRGFVTYVGLT